MHVPGHPKRDRLIAGFIWQDVLSDEVREPVDSQLPGEE